MGSVAEVATGYPGYNAHIPEDSVTVPRVLRDAGYDTFAVGKWHLTPYNAFSEAGPFDRRPLGLGFNRFYGFLGGRNDHFKPLLWEDNHRLPVPDREDYHLTSDLTDRAIAMMRDHEQVATGRPFFLYLAYGAVHSPHQAPPQWRERVRGQFDEGWDVWRERVFARQQELGIVPPGTDLPARNEAVPAWTELDDDQRRLALAFQEAFAAMLEDADAQIGRVLAELDRLELRENTLVVLLSDNGASRAGARDGLTMVDRYRNRIRQTAAEMMAEIDSIGGPASDTDYPMGWAMVANTPFRNFKGEPDPGGTRVPLILSWPGRLPDGELRTQFHHVIDLAPTLYELTGVERPSVVDGVGQSPLQGVSMGYTFAAPEAPTRRRVQYWESSGKRGIWRDGWMAVDLHKGAEGEWSNDGWELYDTRSDFSLAHDRSAEQPALAREMAELWWTEARANNVLPLDDRRFEKTLDAARPKAGLPASTATSIARARPRFPRWPRRRSPVASTSSPRACMFPPGGRRRRAGLLRLALRWLDALRRRSSPGLRPQLPGHGRVAPDLRSRDTQRRRHARVPLHADGARRRPRRALHQRSTGGRARRHPDVATGLHGRRGTRRSGATRARR